MTRFDPMVGLPASVFAERRKSVFQVLGDGIMVLPSAPILYRSRDTEIPYRPDSELFYLTGAVEPDTVAVLVGGAEPRTLLFVPERDPETELWSGRRLDPGEALEKYQVDEVHPRGELDVRLPGLLHLGRAIHVRLGGHETLDRAVVAALARGRSRGPRTGTGPRQVVDPGEILDELRLRKDPHEVERLRAAAALSVEGHLAGLKVLGPQAGEWEVHAAVDAAFRRGGGAGPGYGTIVGSGPNACVLHYVANQRVMGEGDLALVDAGAELHLYQGDITRTYPVSGTFRGPQLDLYQVVEGARAAAVDHVAPGVTLASVHDVAVRVVLEGLVDLGLLQGDVDDLVQAQAQRAFFPHQTSHWLGLDVHDPGDYVRDGAPRVLEPGMVFSVEPGIYVPSDAQGGAAPFAGMGIRVEDDILVTESGHENLTGDLPTAADDVAALVREAR